MNWGLACYRRHHRNLSPLEFVGQQDITSHVEFTSLIETARSCNFSLSGFTDQHHFLIGGAETWLRRVENMSLTSSLQSDLRHLQTLMHPALMGTHFHVLALSHNVSITPLSGFRYASKYQTVNKNCLS